LRRRRKNNEKVYHNTSENNEKRLQGMADGIWAVSMVLAGKVILSIAFGRVTN
jgi:hypothetical protein